MGRDLKLDGIKFLMIYLVVLAHLFYNDWGLRVNAIIYSFHMPVFVFLSGYFTSLHADKEKKFRWIKSTLIIYLVAQLAHFALRIGCEYIVARYHHEQWHYPVISWDILISPNFALWYLVCLIYWRTVVWKLYSRLNDATWIGVSIFLSIISGYIPFGHDFAFQRAFVFFPFFLLGLIFKKRDGMEKLSKLSYFYSVVGFSIGVIIAYYLPIFIPREPYIMWFHPIKRILLSVLGVYMCLLVIRLLRVKFVEKFAPYGAYTIWIYIGHTYFIVAAKRLSPIFDINLNLIDALLLTCVYCALFLGVAKAYRLFYAKVKGSP